MRQEIENHRTAFSEKIGRDEKRKIRARDEPKKSIWSGIATFGMIGWSVTTPTLIGTFSGIWLDKHYPQSFSWTLTLLITGLVAGCFMAAYWVSKEHRDIHKNDLQP